MMRVNGSQIKWILLVILLFLVIAAGYWYLNQNQHVVQTDSNPMKPESQSNETGSNEITPPTEIPVSGESGSEEDLEDLKIGLVDLEQIRNQHPRKEMIYQLEEQIQGYLRELAQQEDEMELAQEQIEAQNTDLNAQLGTQLENIRVKYQKLIDEKSKELQQELTQFEDQAWEDALADIKRKNEDLQDLAEKMIAKYHERQLSDLFEFEEELYQKYYPDIVNLRLKLQLVQLSEEEQKKYREELEQIELEKAKLLEEKKLKLEKELNQYIESKQLELEKDFENFQEQTNQEIVVALKAKQEEMDQLLKEFIVEKEAEMNNESKERQTKLEEEAKTSLLHTQHEIQLEIKIKEELLVSNLENAKTERDQLLAEIDEDIRSIVADLAEEQGYDLVLIDVRVNVAAQDLTEQILEKLNQ